MPGWRFCLGARRTAAVILMFALPMIPLGWGCKKSSNPNSPTALPAWLPPEAAAPAGTSVVTITLLQLRLSNSSPEGAPLLPEDPRVGGQYKLLTWVFVPKGQGGFFDFRQELIFVGPPTKGYRVGESLYKHAGSANVMEGYSTGGLGFPAPVEGNYRFESEQGRNGVVLTSKTLEFTVKP